MNISFIIPSKNPKLMKECYDNLSSTCSSPKEVEILVKVDSLEHKDLYKNILGGGLKYKIIHTPTTGYDNCHTMFEELVPHAESELLWGWGDDYVFAKGDWYKEAMDVRATVTKKVFSLKVPNIRQKRWFSLAPIISKDWFRCLGNFRPPIDYTVGVIARDNNCYYSFSENSKIMIRMPHTPALTSSKTRKIREKVLNEELPSIKKQIQEFEAKAI